MVCEFGVDVLSPEQKTPFFQYLMLTEKKKINDHEEFRLRSSQSPMTEKKVHDLIYSVTGSLDEAAKAVAHFILQKTKPKKE